MSPRTASTTGPAIANPPASPVGRLSGLLPVDRIFVVKLGEPTPGFHSACHGEVEHVLSGRQKTFASAAELLRALGLVG